MPFITSVPQENNQWCFWVAYSMHELHRLLQQVHTLPKCGCHAMSRKADSLSSSSMNSHHVGLCLICTMNRLVRRKVINHWSFRKVAFSFVDGRTAMYVRASILSTFYQHQESTIQFRQHKNWSMFCSDIYSFSKQRKFVFRLSFCQRLFCIWKVNRVILIAYDHCMHCIDHTRTTYVSRTYGNCDHRLWITNYVRFVLSTC